MSDEVIVFVSRGITAGCCNPDSYGTICVGCNQCGRFNAAGEPKSDTTPRAGEKTLFDWLEAGAA